MSQYTSALSQLNFGIGRRPVFWETAWNKEVFPPTQARQYVRRIEFCHTPKHGSWLNIAENELSSMTRQCITGRRINDLKSLREQNPRLVKRCQQNSAWRRLANENQRCPL